MSDSLRVQVERKFLNLVSLSDSLCCPNILQTTESRRS